MALITALCPAACLEGRWTFGRWTFGEALHQMTSCHLVKICQTSLSFSPDPWSRLRRDAKRCKEYSANLDTGPLLQVSADLHAPTTNLSNILQNPAPLNRDSIHSWEPQQLLSYLVEPRIFWCDIQSTLNLGRWWPLRITRHAGLDWK